VAQPQAAKAWLRAALAERGFAGRRVVTCLPADEVRLFPVTCPVLPGQSHEAAIAQALRERLRDELANTVVDYLPIRNEDDTPEQRDALVAVASRDKVMAHLQRLEAAGLTPVALEVGPAALARLVSAVNAADQHEAFPHVLIINFGRQRSHVSVIWGRRLVLDREIDFSEAHLVERVASVLELTPDLARRLLSTTGLGGPAATANTAAPESDLAQTLAEVLRPEIALLVSEINKTLIYTASRSRGRGIDQIYLLGPVGHYTGVDALLAQLLAVPVRLLDPFSAFATAQPDAPWRALAPLAGMAVATGLALREGARHA
jgi:type IV pilus assembly protein PilM